MKKWLGLGIAALYIFGLVSAVFAAAGVEYGIIVSKPAPGSDLGKILGEKMKQSAAQSSPSKPSSSSKVPGKVRVDERKPIRLMPADGGAVDPATGLLYKEEGGGYYNSETTTFVIPDSSSSMKPENGSPQKKNLKVH